MGALPDRGYQKTRAELIGYEQAAFAALRSGVPNCYRDGGSSTAWGWILDALARQVGQLDYLDQYALASNDPSLLTPADIMREIVPQLPIGKDYPSSVQFDEDFKTMVLRLVKAYQNGARLIAIPEIIQAFTGAALSEFSVTEMYKLIGQPGIDVSYRNTIQIEVPIGSSGASSALFTRTPNLIKDIQTAISATKAAHIGIDLVGKLPATEDFSGYLMGIRDKLTIVLAVQDGAVVNPLLKLAPFKKLPQANTVLAPNQGLMLVYEWFKNGQVIPGAELDTYEFTAQAGDNGAEFYVKVTDVLLGSVWSKRIPLVVSPGDTSPLPWALPAGDPVAPAEGTLHVTQQPMSRSVVEGAAVVISVAVADTATVGHLAPRRPKQWVIKSSSFTRLDGIDFVESTFSDPTVFD